MTRARSHRPKSVRKSRATLQVAEEKKFAKAPHSFVFARNNVGSTVRQLSLDLRRIFEPFTATNLQVSKKNVLKDFITIAGPLNVSHILYLTHPRPDHMAAKRARHTANVEKKKEKIKLETGDRARSEHEEDSQSTAKGGVYMHLIRSPNGPSLTFRVLEYSLVKDVFNLVNRSFDNRQFAHAPLLVMTGFSGPTSASGIKEPPPPHARLVVDMLQNMLPPLNIQELKLSTVRRVLLFSREVDGESGDEVIYMRHFNIRIENRTISKALRRLGLGGSALRKRPLSVPGALGKTSGVPNLSKYVNIDDYLTKSNLLTDSATSDPDDLAEVELPGGGLIGDNAEGDNVAGVKPSMKKKEAMAQAKAAHGYGHLSGCRKATIRLSEIGPRLTLSLIKIEEDVNSGNVLYHSWRKKSPAEISRQEELRQQKEAAKAARRALQEKRRLANEAARDLHRRTCLEGQQAAKASRAKSDADDDGDEEDVKNDACVESDDVPVEAKADFDRLMHQVSDEEIEEKQADEDETETAAMKSELPVRSRHISKAKNKKKKKKDKMKVTKKHPAYRYLTEKVEFAKQKRQKKGRQ